MSTLDVLLAAEAAVTGVAQPRTSFRHRYLSDRPMVAAAYRLSGETAAPLGMMYGTAADDPTLRVAAEPRNREIRFREVLNPFAEDLCLYMENHALDREQVQRKYETTERCVDAPQLVCPNRATVEFYGQVLGRSLRYLRQDGDFPVPAITTRAGAHLTWLWQQSALPGSSVLLSATDALRRHWITGQSSLEDEDLHVLLAWIDPPDGMTGLEAALEAERQRSHGTLPSAGPTSDPDWDESQLQHVIEEFNQNRDSRQDAVTVAEMEGPVRDLVATALEPAWRATWRAIDLLRARPEAASVAERWTTDRQDWTWHADRIADDRAWFRARHSARQAAFILSQHEAAQQRLAASEAFDDPVVLAGLASDGDALIGLVTDRDLDHKEQGPKNMVRRPLLTLSLDDPTSIQIGAELWWIVDPGIRVEVVGIEDEGRTIRLKVVAGMSKSLPEQEAWVGLSAVGRNAVPSARLPTDVPWTHRGEVFEDPVEVPE